MPKITVTSTEKLAAQIAVERGTYKGGPVPEWVKKVAEATERRPEAGTDAPSD